MLKPADPALVGNLEDISDFFTCPPVTMQTDKNALTERIRRALRGEEKGQPSIEIMHGHGTAVFTHRELFVRVAAMAPSDQQAFILALRAALLRNEAQTLQIEIPWAKEPEASPKQLKVSREQGNRFVFSLS